MHSLTYCPRYRKKKKKKKKKEDSGNSIPEFTQALMTALEESTSSEPWDSVLRNTLRDQLIDFLNQSTSTKPEYLVRAYEQHLLQLINAQNQRLRVKYADDRKGMLKESGAVKRIISKIPDMARVTFQTHVYNPEKKLRRDDVYDEAEFEEEDGRKSAEYYQRYKPTVSEIYSKKELIKYDQYTKAINHIGPVPDMQGRLMVVVNQVRVFEQNLLRVMKGLSRACEFYAQLLLNGWSV